MGYNIFKFSKDLGELDKWLGIKVKKDDEEDDEDIAPVATNDDDEDDSGWFKGSSAFDDGYDFGDVTKTIKASGLDFTTSVSAGLLGIGEKVVDAGAYLAGGVGGLFGADDFKEDMQDFIAKDLYDEKKVAKHINLTNLVTEKLLGIDTEENSVFGDKVDSLAQSGGELAATAALQYVGVPWWLTTGVTSFGGAVEGASNEGASFEEAGLYGAITMGAEILTEKLFGGSGLGEKGLINLDGLTKGISSKVVKTLADIGVDMAAEGTEEVASSIFTRLGSSLYKEENLGDILASEEAFEEYLDSFIGGAVLGGVMNTGKSVKSIKTGRDYRTGLTENEQKVFDKLYNEKVAEAEKNGKELTKKQKAALYDSTMERLQKGSVSTDTIESMFGGEDYKAYQSILEQEKPFRDQIESIKNNDEISDESKQKLIKTIEGGLQELATETNKAEVRAKLDSVMKSQLVRQNGKNTQTDDYLLESYNEKARSGQTFKVDLSKVKNEKVRENLKTIMGSGIVNNTRGAHEFWEYAAKVSADRGHKIIPTTTADILKMETEAHGAEYVKEHFKGVTPNGYRLADGTIAINVESPNSRRWILGHEIGHSMETLSEYGSLRDLLYSYAETKEGKEAFGKRKSDLKTRYEGVKGADADVELTNDLIGEYLYNDKDFIYHLSTKDRNLFQKIWDEVKYLYKMATAGSQEQRDLLRIQRTFEQAYRESVKAQTKKEGKTELSLSAEQQKNFDYNNNKTNVGDALKTLKGSAIKRSTKYGVGKEIGGEIYFHKEYAEEIVPAEVLSQAEHLLEETNPGFEYNCIKYNPKTGVVAFQEAPDFDTAREPMVGDYVSVNTDTGDVKKGHSNYIWHHKWNWVKNSYKGFDVAESWKWSKQWLSTLTEVSDGNGIGRWNAQLDKFGLPHDGEAEGKISYSLSPVAPVQPTTDAWKRTHTTDEAKDAYPKLWDVSAEESETRNPTQISQTVNTYRKIYNYLKDEGFDGTILDASSGLGYGTKAGIEEYGFDVEDIEPYPDKDYNPKYTDYSQLDKKYDVVISSFVLNVLPQDQRDALVVKMGEMLNDGGRMFVNVRSNDVESLAKTGKNIHLGNMEWIETARGSYQKGFKKAELVAYLKDALGEGFTVTPSSLQSPVSAIVTKNGGAKYSLSDSNGNQLTEAQAEYFKDSVVRDDNGNLLKVYHTTNNDFTVFDKSKKGEATGDSNTYLGFFFADDPEYMQNFPEFENGKTEAYYLNMTNPIDMTDVSKEAFLDIVEVLGGDVTEAAEVYDEEFADEQDRAKLRGDNNTSLQLNRLMESVSGEYFSYYDFIDELKPHYDELMAKGYDGVVNYLDELWGAKEYIVLDSNQAKLASNLKPTANEDVRYSLGDGREVEVVDGIAVAPNVATMMKSGEYAKPNDYMVKYSISTTPAWEKNYLALHHDEEDLKVVDAIRKFTDKMVQDDAVRGYVPTGEYKYTSMGPLRSNVEYIRTFDMDTSCPRTFQFLNFRDAIQRKAGRYLSYNESINLLELMRAYGQQIPCCYCYVENKRVLLSASYNNFFGFRNAVMNAETDADAEKVMYGYSEKKGLPEASRKALTRWRSDMNYNPSLTEVWTATNTARNSVLNYLDAQKELGNINEKTAEAKLNKMVLEQFGIADKGAIAEIQTFVQDWAYDTLANIPHIYNTDNDPSVSVVDERALALNHEALSYSKSASSAKNVENYVPYTDQLKNISKEEREYIMGMGGIRKHSSNDFRMDYVQDYFLFYADLAADKWTGHTYTKSADFTKIFACTNDRINMSVAFYEDADGGLRENIDEGASWKDVRELRKAYKNVGSMAMVTSDNQLSYALNSDWIDMIIPFHASGLDKAVWYNLRMWNDYTTKQGERFFNAETMRQRLTDAGVEVPKRASSSVVKALFEETFHPKHIYGKDGEVVKPHFFPGDTYVNGQLVPGHHNDAETYFRLCEEYGVHPRFYGIKVTDTNGNQIDVTEHPSYVKLIKETSRTDSAQEAIQFNFGNYDDFLKMTPFEYAMKRLQEEAKNGGFENTKADPYGVVDEFINEYLDKDRPLGYLTERAKETRDILLEMSKENAAKQAEIVEKEVNAFSLSKEGDAPIRFADESEYTDRYIAPTEDIAPMREDVAKTATTTPMVDDEEGQTAPMEDVEMMEEEASPMDDIAPVMEEETEPTVETEPAEEQKIKTVKERLSAKLQNIETELANNQRLREESKTDFDKEIARLNAEYDAKKNKNTKVANDILRRIERLERIKGNVDADYAKRISDLEQKKSKVGEEVRKGQSSAEERTMRKDLHRSIIERIKAKFAKIGMDFDEVLKKAKDLSTFATVDNTPQRVMEKSLGYKAGQILADETVNKVAQNETEGIKWLNSFTDRKNGLLAKISKQYNIKPGSKESAAAQMYAEGFYVDEDNNIVAYGDAELAKDFPDASVRENIKGLAKDERIRKIYDDTLAAINESRVRNGYPEIPRLDNYFLHFRAMDDTFSRIGLPFNPNDIKAKDLPTDLNGVTADLKPGQPYFASAKHRMGKRTSFDLLGGLERYLSSAKNQIYHIDDIQTLRALRNYIADTYGQANGLEGLDALNEEEAQEKIKQVYGSHLSTFAKFLNEEANVIAGKTALIDRGIEGIIGRRGITFIDTINKQVGSNMVGFNLSSSLTNFIAGVQAIAKTSKLACIKSLAQTTTSRVKSIFGVTDSFVENNPTIIRRNGAERFYRTPFQKVGDAGYVLMSAVDNITTEFIVRAKYNEFISKGMSEEQAILEADKWTSRLMGDRSLGQQPQIFNSKMLGTLTKFQLEVRNQLDSQFYDTIQEAKASNEDIENGLARNAKTAAKVTATIFELAVLQHLFGKAFESVAGYNPAFDIIGVLIKALGFDDEEDSEDTALDNIEQGFLELVEDLPYTSTFTGGRIPISSALPIGELIKGEDEYGNEKSRLETLKEVAPYYLLPTGYGQLKKTTQGLAMFDDDLPIAGSYTDSGNLRFPVEDTFGNRLQAGLFGQWANENARDYIDNERSSLKPKQIKEFIDSDMPISDYWDYREGLSGLNTLEEKADYINSLDLTTEQKNLLINNIANRNEDIDLSDYGEYEDFAEFDFAQNNSQKYALAKSVGGYTSYKKYMRQLNNIKADKDEDGKAISGSRKEKVIDYINNLDADYGERIILYKSEYKADDAYNMDIIEYLNSRDDLSYEEIGAILRELGFNVNSATGDVTWD